MPEQKNINIIATIGPASKGPKKIKTLRESGANIFRLNFSHGSHDDHKKAAQHIRKAETELGQETYILADLQGPKLRIGTFENESIELKENMVFRFDLDPAPGNETRVCLPHEEIIEALEEKSKILLDDGRVCMEIIKKGKGYVKARVLNGTSLSNRKGVNVPGVYLPIEALTNKDLEDLNVALDINADYIALSFVQKASDVKKAKALIKGKAKIIAKIEKPQALQNFDAILKEADGIMVARGDLGVEIPPEYVPGVQREIIRRANLKGKFVIVATQMLDSMISHPLPTRAEVNDVSYAVFKGADAVMLSGESAIGAHPVKAVAMMRRIFETAVLEKKDHQKFLSLAFRQAQKDPKAQQSTEQDEDKNNAAPKKPGPRSP
jgi:pyruvate kinase